MKNLDLSNLPKPADELLVAFITQLISVQPNFVQGVYLTGSISLNDFHPPKSDIDFIVLLKAVPYKELLQQYERIHNRIKRKYGRPALNGYYIPVALLFESAGKNRGNVVFFSGNKLYANYPFELDKVTLFELKTNSLMVYGSSSIASSTNTTIDEVRIQLHQNINTYWANWAKKHASFGIRFLLLMLFPRLTEWGVLGVARQLYTLQTGAITSKLQAGYYCLGELPVTHHTIISTAIETRKDNRTLIRPSYQRAKKTIACMRYIIGEFNHRFKG